MSTDFEKLDNLREILIRLQTGKQHRGQAFGAKMHLQNFEKLQSRKSESGFIPFARSATSLGEAHIIEKHIM